tara:strand:- start:2277 stop:2477 length:201 start_codon:yes stop_codon:yes gene_type:complete
MYNRILLDEYRDDIADDLRQHGISQGTHIAAKYLKAHVDCYWWQFERGGATPPRIRETIAYVAKNL